MINETEADNMRGWVRRKSATCEKCGAKWKGGWDFVFFDKDEFGVGALCLECCEADADPELI